MASPRQNEPSPELGSLALLYDAIKREIDHVRDDVGAVRADMQENNDSLSKDIRTVQTAVTHLGERIHVVEQTDRDTEITNAVRATIRKRFTQIALGSATFASCVAAVVSLFAR